jgi:ABC-type multidrug transport system ATPase subunit/peptidoglycan/LPS O-acetylase OafA/YrhL
MQSEQRLHALDAVRAFALLLGIVLHATMSFLPALAAAGWPIVDNSPSEALGITFSVIHIFRMATFFVMAGFFARLLIYRRGVDGFIKDRLKRILAPLVVAWPIVFLLIGLVMVWAMTKAGKSFVAPPTESVPLPFPWTHLWFLYVLLVLYVVVLSLRWLANTGIDRNGKIRIAIDKLIGLITTIPIAPLFLAVPVAASLYATPSWVVWSGIPTPDNSLLPNLPALIGYGTAILFGWFLHRQIHLLQTFQRFWVLYLVIGVLLAIVCLSMGGTPGMTTLPVLDANNRVLYAACYGVAIWSWTFAAIGAACKFLSGESAVRRYLADSSYWLYILHLPIVFALQALVSDWSMHWSAKFTIIVGGSVAVLLVSYHYLVRPTYIGEVLNGRRYPRKAKETSLPLAKGPSNIGDDMNALAALSKVQKSYGSIKALNDIDLEIRRGELLAVLGPNGAGKSTAIAVLLGLQQPTAGSVHLFGQAPNALDARRQVGVMMQEVTLAPELTVREHIDLTASYYPEPLSVDETIATVGIGDLANRPYRQLSGGQKRQVQFAMAICGKPQLLFLDEPTVGLDIRAREAMWETIRKLLARGCSIVLTTHYLEEAEALANRVVVINKGNVIASGSVAELRSFVSRRQINCTSSLSVDHIRSWDRVGAVKLIDGRLSITTADAESVVRRLLTEDASLAELEVRRAGLSDVFTELTQETV